MPGFTLVEVLITTVIIGLLLIPIFANQTTIVRAVSRSSHALSRIFQAKKILIDQEFSLGPEVRDLKQEKKAGIPPITFTYELKKIPNNSSLNKFNNVLMETVSWPHDQDKNKKERLVTFLYKPEQS